jgi:hypothetical protein
MKSASVCSSEAMLMLMEHGHPQRLWEKRLGIYSMSEKGVKKNSYTEEMILWFSSLNSQVQVPSSNISGYACTILLRPSSHGNGSTVGGLYFVTCEVQQVLISAWRFSIKLQLR